MRKLLFILLLTPFFTQAQVADTVKQLPDSAVVANYLFRVERWSQTCGSEGKLLALEGKQIGVDVAEHFKSLPPINSQESLVKWFESVKTSWAALFPLVSWLVVALLKILQKDPTQAKGKLEAFFALIRTRYLVVFGGVALTVVGVVQFDWGVFDAAVALIGTIGGSVVIQWLTELLTRLFGKKQA